MSSPRNPLRIDKRLFDGILKRFESRHENFTEIIENQHRI
uniref:Transcriptional regulator n=1 Tax=Ascaris lumbricoides TaxID=6252 RepID=A0A0M3IVX0_ASCLU